MSNQKIHFISYGNHRFEKSKRRIKKEAEDFQCFDTIKIYSPQDIDHDFYHKFKHVLSQPRLGGYCLWKFYIYLKHMKIMNENDILVYADAGCTINIHGKPRFKEYIDMLNNNENVPIIGFELNNLPEREWTTNEIYRAFRQNIDNNNQIMATVMLFKKTRVIENAIQKCLDIIQSDEKLITDHYNNGNKVKRKEFKENRHDQSFFSLMRKEIGYIPLSDETYPPKNMRYPFWATRIRE